MHVMSLLKFEVVYADESKNRKELERNPNKTILTDTRIFSHSNTDFANVLSEVDGRQLRFIRGFLGSRR